MTGTEDHERQASKFDAMGRATDAAYHYTQADIAGVKPAKPALNQRTFIDGIASSRSQNLLNSLVPACRVIRVFGNIIVGCIVP